MRPFPHNSPNTIKKIFFQIKQVSGRHESDETGIKTIKILKMDEWDFTTKGASLKKYK